MTDGPDGFAPAELTEDEANAEIAEMREFLAKFDWPAY